MQTFIKDKQYWKFSMYGFLKNLRFFDVFFILILVDRGLSYTEIGVLYAIREICINGFEVPSGILADSYGRKRALIAAFFAYITSFVVFYFSKGFWSFVPAMALYGMADAFRSGTNKGMIMDYLRSKNWTDQKVSYLGHTRSWAQKGSAISSLLAGLFVLLNGNYDMVFLLAILPYFLNLWNVYSYPDELNFSTKSKPTNSTSFRTTLMYFLEYIRKPEVLSIMNSAALHSAYMKSLKDYIQPLMVQMVILIPFIISEDEVKRSGLIIGVIYFFIFLITSYSSKNAAKLLKFGWSNMSYKTLLVGLLFGISCGVFYRMELWLIALLFFILIYVIENLRKPILTGELAEAVSGDVLTSVLSAQSLLQSLMTITISIFFGFMADQLGIGSAFIVSCSMLIVISMTLQFFTKGGQS